MNKNNKNELENMRNENRETINSSHNMANLIQEYLHEENEEKKKKLFSQIMTPKSSEIIMPAHNKPVNPGEANRRNRDQIH